jgi:hypothetical protein
LEIQWPPENCTAPAPSSTGFSLSPFLTLLRALCGLCVEIFASERGSRTISPSPSNAR